MRLMDIIMAVPGIAMAAVSVLPSVARRPPGNTWGLVVVIIRSIAFVHSALSRTSARTSRPPTGEDYVRAVIVSGARAPWILVTSSCATRQPQSWSATVLVADAITSPRPPDSSGRAQATTVGQRPVCGLSNLLRSSRWCGGRLLPRPVHHDYGPVPEHSARGHH